MIVGIVLRPVVDEIVGWAMILQTGAWPTLSVAFAISFESFELDAQ